MGKAEERKAWPLRIFCPSQSLSLSSPSQHKSWPLSGRSWVYSPTDIKKILNYYQWKKQNKKSFNVRLRSVKYCTFTHLLLFPIFFIVELYLKPDACKELSNAMSPWLLRKDSNSHQLSNMNLRIANCALETYLDNQSLVQSKFHCVGIFFLENQILWSHHYTRNDKLYHNTLHSNDIQALFHGAV